MDYFNMSDAELRRRRDEAKEELRHAKADDGMEAGERRLLCCDLRSDIANCENQLETNAEFR